MPIVSGLTAFAFKLDLTSGMRLVDGGGGTCDWIDYKEEDGTRFHYTWRTTESYRYCPPLSFSLSSCLSLSLYVCPQLTPALT